MNDSNQEEEVPEDRLNEQEKAILKYVREQEKKIIGVIDTSMPESLYNYMCFIVSHYTSTSFLQVKTLDFFDFMSLHYLIGKFLEETQGNSSPTPSHQTSPEKKILGI